MACRCPASRPAASTSGASALSSRPYDPSRVEVRGRQIDAITQPVSRVLRSG